MSELNPPLQAYGVDSNAIDANMPANQNRLTVLTRNAGYTRAVLWEVGQSSVANTNHYSFMNGSAWDMTVNGSATPQTFTVSASSTTTTIASVNLIMLTTARAPVFNGASFGGQFLGGLLNLTVLTPAALSNGLLFTCTAAGITTNFANLTVNEDFFTGNINGQFGPTGGPYLLRAKWDINQVLTGGSSDRLTFTVQDDMTTRGIAEIRGVAISVVN